MEKDFEVIKNKYLNELASIEVGAEDLLAKKLPVDVLKLERYLQSIYGDKIYENKQVAEISNKQKSIKKISKDDMEISKIIKEVSEEIDASEFDKRLDSILK